MAVGLAVRGQQLLNRPEYPWDGPIVYALAVGLFLWGLSRWREGEPWGPALDPPRQRGIRSGESFLRLLMRVGFGLEAAVLALIAYYGFADNHFSKVGVVAWLGALTTFLLATVRGPSLSGLVRRLREGARGAFEGIGDGGRSRSRAWRTAVIVGAIVVMGAFFRLYRLPGVPSEMTSDHAEKLLDVNNVLRGMRPVFFPRNTGREAMQFYLTAALIRFTPLTISHLALKVGTAMVSIVTIPLAFLLGRSMYGRQVGFLTACFVALSRWHVAISRVGLRFPFTPLFTTLVLIFLFRAFRHNRRNDWLACGMALGAGLHSYTAVRILPLLLVVLVAVKAIVDLVEWARGADHVPEKTSVASRMLALRKGSLGASPSYVEETALSARFWVNALLGALASGLVFLPLLRYMRDEPDMFWFRVSTRLAEAERALPAHPWRVLLGNVKDALLMFNYRGGPVWVNTVPGDPVLSCVVGGLFVLGVVFALWCLFGRGDRRGLYLLLSLVVLLLPSALSIAFPVENPSVVRTAGAIPVAALLAALATHVAIRDLWSALNGGREWLVAALPSLLLLAAACLTYRWYFVTYDRQYRRTAWNTTDMGRVVRSFADSVGDMDHAYHIPYPHWADTRNIGINAGDIGWRNSVDELEDLRAHVEDPAPKLYLVYPGDGRSLRFLRDLFPRGRLERYRSKVPGKDFLIYVVPEEYRPGPLRSAVIVL